MNKGQFQAAIALRNEIFLQQQSEKLKFCFSEIKRQMNEKTGEITDSQAITIKITFSCPAKHMPFFVCNIKNFMHDLGFESEDFGIRSRPNMILIDFHL